LLSKIRADHDLLLEETDIDSILTGCSTEYGSEIQTLVERGAESFVADLFRTLRERKIELRNGKVIFVGGGSLLLRKQIEKSGKVGTAIFVEEIGANAAGYGLLYAMYVGTLLRPLHFCVRRRIFPRRCGLTASLLFINAQPL